MSAADGLAIARRRIAEEAEQRTGFLDIGNLGLVGLPDELFALRHLRTLNLGHWWYDISVRRIIISSGQLSPNDPSVHLNHLQELPNLQALIMNNCKIQSLQGLESTFSLREIWFSSTEVADLQPLASLIGLRLVSCARTVVEDLGPLRGLCHLQDLSCLDTRVQDLEVVEDLSSLRVLDCSQTQVRDLTPLARLIGLQELHCRLTQVRDLEPIGRLDSLQMLDCAGNEVSSLAPLEHLKNLRYLNCSGSKVKDFAPLVRAGILKVLHASGCVITNLPLALVNQHELKEIVAFKSTVDGVPSAALSQSSGENCLEALRAHVRDLEAGEVRVSDVKLMVLGNGRVGKTQVCRRLRGKGYDECEGSTHGILVTSALLPVRNGDPARLNMWDFGGQDLYHGTHALFTRSGAIFLLCWTPSLENTSEGTADGVLFRNHPLAYWVDYVRHVGGRNSVVIILQTQCDEPEDEAPCPVPEADLFRHFGFRKLLHVSARTLRGFAALEEALADAVAWLRQREGIAVIGAGRAKVQRRLEEMRDADAALAPEERRHRTITQNEFRTLCEETGGVSSTQHLLTYFDNAGIVFYRPGLFHDQIILDQEWALEAIYAVFHRDKSYRYILRQKGRFTAAELDVWVWRERAYGQAEQKLLLSMMLSCGICFPLREWGREEGGETEYVAPDLLPQRADVEVELQQKWDDDLPTEKVTYTYPMLHRGLMRSIISRIGRNAGLAAEYWRGGVYVYETNSRSRGMIEEEMLDGRRGCINVRTQRGQSALLLQRLRSVVQAEQVRADISPESVAVDASAHARISISGTMRAEVVPAAPEPLSFAQEKPAEPEWCVSYAWGDGTQEGREREGIVDQFCAAGEAHGIKIIRDKTALRFGDIISKFMRRIGQGDRVFVILSDKYLRSASCMFELSEIWRTSKQEDETFRQKIRPYTTADAKIWTSFDRANYAVHWKEQFDRLAGFADTHGRDAFDILGKSGADELRLLKHFYQDVSDILALVADTLQPRTFEELVKYSFDDAPMKEIQPGAAARSSGAQVE